MAPYFLLKIIPGGNTPNNEILLKKIREIRPSGYANKSVPFEILFSKDFFILSAEEIVSWLRFP